MMPHKVFLLVLVPTSALVSKHLSVSLDPLPSSFVFVSSGPKGDAEKAYAAAVEDLKKQGFPEARVQMYTRLVPVVSKTPSLMETNKQEQSSWPWDKEEQPQGNGLKGKLVGPNGQPLEGDFVMEVVPVQRSVPVATEEYVIVSDKGPDGKPLTELEKKNIDDQLSKNAPHAKRITGAEADKMMKGLLGSFGGLLGPGGPFGGIGGPSFEKALGRMGGAGHGGVTKSTTICENGKCTRTEEYADPNYVAPTGGQQAEQQADLAEGPAQTIELPKKVNAGEWTDEEDLLDSEREILSDKETSDNDDWPNAH